MTSRAERTKASLPSYDAPPINEVAFGVQFPPIQGLVLPHFGLFWSEIRDKYTRCEHAAPVLRPGEEPYLDPATGVPWPRIWFTTADGHALVQLQIDRFLYNWRMTPEGGIYPRFPALFETFKENLSRYQGFLSREKLPPVEPREFELTYINLILQGDAWQTTSDLDKVFRDFPWRRTKARFLSPPTRIDWGATFEIPEAMGTLSVRVRPALRRTDQKPLMGLELTVRGSGGDYSREGTEKWFSLAHEWIVRGFADLTTEQAQTRVWHRKSD